MTATAHFDLKMDADEKAIVAKAAALLGTTMAGFVRLAAKEKAQVLLDREARLTQAILVNVHCAKLGPAAISRRWAETPIPANHEAICINGAVVEVSAGMTV